MKPIKLDTVYQITNNGRSEYQLFHKGERMCALEENKDIYCFTEDELRQLFSQIEVHLCDIAFDCCTVSRSEPQFEETEWDKRTKFFFNNLLNK